MALTSLAEVTNNIQTYWSPLFTKELRESLLLGSLVNKEYEGAISAGGDTVRVSQVNAPAGQLLTVGTNADTFESEALSTTYIDIKADKRAVASFEFTDLASLQSQLSLDKSDVRDSLNFAIAKQINDHLYSLVSPSTSSPDHLIASVTDMNAAQLSAVRLLAAKAKWGMGNWYGLVDPSYYSDIIDDTTLSSQYYGATDSAMIGGQVVLPRMGFKILEDNSRATDTAIFFHPDFMHYVSQSSVSVRISDLHSQKKFGVLLSVDIIFGAKLGINGSVKHIKVYNS